MNDINKQKFLAELGKLLTFMYEEDRQTALAMYEKMFDDAGDEQSLLQLLVSPTRQAVVVARAYDARDRKLQTQAQARGSERDFNGDGVPDFVQAIEQIQLSALQREIVAPAVSADQFSLFEDDSQPDMDMPESVAPADDEGPSFDPANYGFGEEPELAPEAADEDEQPGPNAAQEAAPMEDGAVEDVSSETESAENDPVHEFMESFSVANDELAVAFEAEDDLLPAEENLPVSAEPAEEKVEIPSEASGKTVRKPRVFLMILYTLIAVPVSLIGLSVLLIPTLVFLVLSVLVICTGGVAVSAAFGGFAVFADILIMLGAAIIVLALGLLFLWIFVWFIGGAIVGLFRGIIKLGSKCCYKEVPAE